MFWTPYGENEWGKYSKEPKQPLWCTLLLHISIFFFFFLVHNHVMTGKCAKDCFCCLCLRVTQLFWSVRLAGDLSLGFFTLWSAVCRMRWIRASWKARRGFYQNEPTNLPIPSPWHLFWFWTSLFLSRSFKNHHSSPWTSWNPASRTSCSGTPTTPCTSSLCLLPRKSSCA